MQGSITEIIRVCVGSFLVIYGYIMSIIERYLGMPFFGSRYQPKGVINGFVATLAGAVLMSITVQRFFLIGLPLIVINGLLQKIIHERLKKKAKHFIGKEGKATTDMKRKCKGFVDFNGERAKVFPEEEDIQVGEMVYVSDVDGNMIMVRKLK